jgi:hypothetical protein
MYNIVLGNLNKLDWYHVAMNKAVPVSFVMEHMDRLIIDTKIQLCARESMPLTFIRDMLQSFDTYNYDTQKKLKKNISLNQNMNTLRFLAENKQWIDWDYLSENPEAVWILERNPDRINFEHFVKNEKACDLFMQYKDRFPKYYDGKISISIKAGLSKNPCAIPFLKKYPKYIDWYSLAFNPNPEAIALFEAKPRMIDWLVLSRNPSPEAMSLLKKNPDKIWWHELSKNESDEAIDMLQKNPEEINWHSLSENKNPAVFPLLYANIKKLDFFRLSENPIAIPILEEYPKKIHFDTLSDNPNPDVWEPKTGYVLK